LFSAVGQKRGFLCYVITYNIIWANQITESFEYHWLLALAMFDVMSFPAILSSIGRYFKFCRYVNYRVDKSPPTRHWRWRRWAVGWTRVPSSGGAGVRHAGSRRSCWCHGRCSAPGRSLPPWPSCCPPRARSWRPGHGGQTPSVSGTPATVKGLHWIVFIYLYNRALSS